MNGQSSYNLLLVANDAYFKLLRICLKSICAVCEMDNIQKIFIADLGLSGTNKKIIAGLSEKIEIVDTGTVVSDSASAKIYSSGWVSAVSQKTAVLYRLVQGGHVPVIMIDSDTIAVEDFSGLIDRNCDIQVCRRASPLKRPDGLAVEYIASFFSVNTAAGISFIEAWINRIEERIRLNMIPPYETPAMVEILQNNTSLVSGSLDDRIVSCENNFFPGVTRIIHAKGRTAKDTISIFRFANIKNLPYKKVIRLFEGNEKIPFTVVFALKKIFSLYDFLNFLRKIKRKFKAAVVSG